MKTGNHANGVSHLPDSWEVRNAEIGQAGNAESQKEGKHEIRRTRKPVNPKSSNPETL